MLETKVRLSLVIPGATMLSSQECEKMSKEDAFDHSTLLIDVVHKKGKKVYKDKELLDIYTRKSRYATQNICLNKDAYKYMTSDEIPLAKYAKKVKVSSKDKPDRFVPAWAIMSINQRLKVHFDLIAQHLGAVSYTYQILED